MADVKTLVVTLGSEVIVSITPQSLTPADARDLAQLLVARAADAEARVLVAA